MGLKAKNQHAVPGFIFFSEKAFQWLFLCIFIFSLAFVALSDVSLHLPAGHLKYINEKKKRKLWISDELPFSSQN